MTNKRVLFDKVCKNLVCRLGAQLGFDPIENFYVDTQKDIEVSLGYLTETHALSYSIDVAWTSGLPKFGLGKANPVRRFFSDVIVAWEIDSALGRKAIRSSIENLNLLNPRLGIEFILLGGNTESIRGFNRRFQTALNSARKKRTRIRVIHDLIFSQIYFQAFSRHPQDLYDIYIEKSRQDPKIGSILKGKVSELMKATTKLDLKFKQEFKERFYDRLSIT